MEFKLYDLKDSCPSFVWDILEEELEAIAKSKMALKYNYTMERLRLDQMLTYDVLINMENLEIVCMSGLQRITDDIGRVSSRYYVPPKYSDRWHRKKRFRPNWDYLIPNQIRVAREHGLSGLFWSMENISRDIFFQQISEYSLPYLKPHNCSSKTLDGYYNINDTKQRVCQVILNEKSDYALNLPPMIKQGYDPEFKKYELGLSKLLDNKGLDVNDHTWLSDESIINVINLTEMIPDHTVIKYIERKYYKKLYKVMLARVYADVPEHRDASVEAKAFPVHMKIKLKGDWSGFKIKENVFSTTTSCNNKYNIMQFDNERYTHSVEGTTFDVLIPYGVLNDEENTDIGYVQ